MQAGTGDVARTAPGENLRDELVREPLSSMFRLRVDVEDVRGGPPARVGSRWIVLMQQRARARDDLAAGFCEPADVLARTELANETRARCPLHDCCFVGRQF